MVNLNVQIRDDQHENLKKLAILRQLSIAETLRTILDEALGTVDAGHIVYHHPNGGKEKIL